MADQKTNDEIYKTLVEGLNLILKTTRETHDKMKPTYDNVRDQALLLHNIIERLDKQDQAIASLSASLQQVLARLGTR